MTREQLAHVLRAAAEIVSDGEILVIGSQAILGSYPEDVLPEQATMSVEADLAFFDDPGAAKADRVDGAIGEGSGFHELYGFYAQGVEVSTATLPAGWRQRVVRFVREDTGESGAVCLEAHDLVVSKLHAGRAKDVSFATALLAAGLVDVQTLLGRVDLLDLPEGVRRRIRASVERCAAG